MEKETAEYIHATAFELLGEMVQLLSLDHQMTLEERAEWIDRVESLQSYTAQHYRPH